MSYTSCISDSKKPIKSGNGSSHSYRERRLFPKGATGTTQRGKPEPILGDHNLTTQRNPHGKINQRGDGKKNPSAACIVTHPVQLNPRQDGGRSTGRSIEKRGASVRSSSCEVSYSRARNTRENAPFHGPLDDVMKTLKDGELCPKLVKYIASLKSDCDHLKSQVSLYKWKLSSPKSLDERYLENVSEKTRPSTLVERFKELESTEWLKAKENLDRRFGEDDESTFHLLCSTLMVAFQFAREHLQELYHHQNDIIRGCVHSEDLATTAHSPMKSVEEEANQLPVPLRDMLNKRWRSDSETCSIQQLEKKTMSVLSKAYGWRLKEIGCNDIFRQYLSVCCRLAWQMNIMQPPMHISVEGEVYNEKDHRVWYKCERSQNARIKFYVWPALYDSVGGKLLQPGLVFLDKCQRTEQHQIGGGRDTVRLLKNRRR